MEIIEQTARTSYGKLLAILTKASNGDVALAEDVLSQAFIKALEVWPVSGAPSNPDGWLVKTARNAIIDRFRHLKVQDQSIDFLLDRLEQDTSDYPDQRMALLFVCAHPAISEEIRTPLMLQIVVGLSIEQIASAFLLSPAALEKRLVRAKKKIKEAGIPFEIPEKSELSARLEDVLDAVYAAYGTSWNEMTETLEGEALFLTRLIVETLPLEAEPKGLLALMQFSSSRKIARRLEGRYVPLDEQDVQLWDKNLLNEADALLRSAFELKNPGRYQWEAAIQSGHVARRLLGIDNRRDLLALYRVLLTAAPSVGAWLSYAGAFLSFGEDLEAQKILDALESEGIECHQPYWVLKATLAAKLGQQSEAIKFYEQAIGLTEDAAVVVFLRAKLDHLSK